MAKRLLFLRVYVAESIHNHDNATRVTQHNAQYAKLLSRRGYLLFTTLKTIPTLLWNYASKVVVVVFFFIGKTSIWKCLLRRGLNGKAQLQFAQRACVKLRTQFQDFATQASFYFQSGHSMKSIKISSL